MAPVRLNLALVNLQRGLDHGREMDLLPAVLSPCADAPPDLIVINEACWLFPRLKPARHAANLLSREWGVEYEIAVGDLDRSYHPPALMWNASRLRLDEWSDARTDAHLWSRNTAVFTSREDPLARVRVVGAHWDYSSPTRRRMEAEALGAQCAPPLPTLVGGDLNGTASGLHLPQRDFSLEPPHKRGMKGKMLPDGSYVAATEAVDHLIGVWNERFGQRVGGAGLYALAERDWLDHGQPEGWIVGSTYSSQPLLIDYWLASPQIDLVKGTYRAWEGHPGITDHKLITATVRLNRQEAPCT